MPRKKKEKQKKLVVVVDYQNVALANEAVLAHKILDFEMLRQRCLEIGPVAACFLFIPSHWVDKESVREAEKNCFFIIACHGVALQAENHHKIEDTVDIQIIKFVRSLLLDNSDITDIVVVGSDKHMLHFIQPAKWQDKMIHIFSGAELASVLKEVVFSKNIHPLPLKEGEI